MNSERWQRVEDLYHAAMQCGEGERAAFLESACAGDESLRQEVESLVAYGHRTDNLKEGAALEALAQVLASESNPERDLDEIPSRMLGKRISQYQIQKLLGRGGMGEVYLAVRADEQFQQRVAIKIVRTGDNSGFIIRRFKNERQILASLDHPNIARLLDGGTTEEGVPYFVMDLIVGDPIDQYCDSHKLDIEERLKLFLQVCSALQYAHQRQIIHRDIKPSNIFVTQEGVPKLLDFGIAKLLDAGFDPGATGPTETRFRLFTPLYASPEQIKGEPVSAASDVYSMGVLLYVLLTGQRPYQFRTTAPSEIERVICEEEPVKPSTAVTRTEEPATPQAAAVSVGPEKIGLARGTDPVHLHKRLRGDLDAIVMMALRKEPERRYASVAEFSQDISKHLEGRTIAARTSNFSYRTARFLRRHQEMAAGALISALLLSGVAVWRARHAGGQPTAPQTSAVTVQPRRSIAVLGFKNLAERPSAAWLSTALSEMLTTELAAGEKMRTVPEADVARAKADLSVSDVASLGADTLERLRKNLGSDFIVSGSYLALEAKAGGQIRLDMRLLDSASGIISASVSETGSEARLLDLVSRAGAQLRSKLGVDLVSTAEAGTVGASLPASLEAMRFYSEGLAKFRAFDSLAARDLLQKAVAADPRFAPGRSALADVWSSLGYDQKAKDEAKKAFDLSPGLAREEQLLIEARYRAANDEYDRALEIYKSLFTMFPDNLDYGLALVEAQRDASKSKDSLAILDRLRKLPPPVGEDPRIDLFECSVQNDLSNFKESQAAADRAVVKATALGDRDVVARAYHEEGQVLYAMGNYEQALRTLESASAIYEATGDRFHASENDVSLAQLAYLQLDFARAKTYLRKALTLARAIGSQEAPMVAQNVMGNILRAEGDLKGAGFAYGESDRIARELNEEPARTSPLDGLAWVDFDQGDLSKASQKFEEQIALGEKRNSSNGIGLGHTGLGKVLLVRGDLPAARQHYTKAIEVFEKSNQKYRLAKAKVLLASVSVAEGHSAEVAEPVQQVREFFQASKTSYGEVLAATVMAHAFLAQGKTLEAQKELEAVARLVSNTIPIDARLDYAIVHAQTNAASGQTAPAIVELKSSLEVARTHGFVPQQFDARLALGEVEIKAGQRERGRSRLTALEKDAASKGFHLIAREAAAAAKKTN